MVASQDSSKLHFLRLKYAELYHFLIYSKTVIVDFQ